MKRYPTTYLHIGDCKTGEEYVVPIDSDTPLNLVDLIDDWIEYNWQGDRKRFGGVTPRLDGDYYGKIMTERRPPTSCVCYSGGGFHVVPKK
jgi:hypothetical protein